MSSSVATITMYNALFGVLVGASALLIGHYFHLWRIELGGSGPKRKRGLFPGLYNMGNTCFVNALLQALASSRSLAAWLQEIDQNLEVSEQSSVEPNSKSNCPESFLCQLKSLLKVLNSKTSEVASAEGILNALRSHGWVITPGIEQDCQELMDVCFSTIDDELQLSSSSVSSLLDSSVLHDVSSSSENEKSYVAGKDYFRLLHCLSSVVLERDKRMPPFKGLISTLMRCQYGHEHVKHDLFNSLPLMLTDIHPGSLTLEHCLKKYFGSEVLHDVSCESCSRNASKFDGSLKRRFLRKQYIAKFPKCLIISLHRVGWSQGLVMNSQHVAFPELLNLHQFAFGGKSGVSFPSGISQSSSCPDPVSGTSGLQLSAQMSSIKHCYRLSAVILHFGHASAGGHFVTYRRAAGGMWLYASDETVRPASFAEVFSCQAYALFYEKLLSRP